MIAAAFALSGLLHAPAANSPPTAETIRKYSFGSRRLARGSISAQYASRAGRALPRRLPFAIRRAVPRVAEACASMREISAFFGLVLVLACAASASALPGDTFAAEKARLAAISTLRPLAPLEGLAGHWSTHPVSGGDETQGEDGWALTVVTANGNVARESLDVKAFGKPYAIAKDGAATFATVFGTATAQDFAASKAVATQHDDPQITQTFRHGAKFAYRTVDDQRNGLHTLEFFKLSALAQQLQQYSVTSPPPTNTGGNGNAAIFVVQQDGALAPVAVRNGTTFMPPGSNDGQPSTKLQNAANAALANGGNKVNLIFGDRTVATGVPVTVIDGRSSIPVPSSMHLGGYIGALASPTLNGTAPTPRRAPTAAERASVLTAAAMKLGTEPSRLTVRNLTAIDLGHGTALAGTANWKGTGTPRIDRRVFFIAETIDGKRTMTLWNRCSKSPPSTSSTRSTSAPERSAWSPTSSATTPTATPSTPAPAPAGNPPTPAAE
jgi:hypothetical protein